MKTVSSMSNEEILAEQRRRDARRANGLPLTETPAELAERIVEEDSRLEKQIQADVIKLYRAHGCVVFNLSQARATKQTPGIGDLYVFWPEYRGLGPTVWWHETKTPAGKLRPDQREFQQLCEECLVGHVVGGVAAAEYKLRAIGAWSE